MHTLIQLGSKHYSEHFRISDTLPFRAVSGCSHAVLLVDLVRGWRIYLQVVARRRRPGRWRHWIRRNNWWKEAYQSAAVAHLPSWRGFCAPGDHHDDQHHGRRPCCDDKWRPAAAEFQLEHRRYHMFCTLEYVLVLLVYIAARTAINNCQMEVYKTFAGSFGE